MPKQISNVFKLTDMEKKWALYDVGNSSFILLVSTIFPIYFNYLTELGGIDPATALIYWGYSVSIVTIIVAIFGPILGSISDINGMKKKLLAWFTALGVVGCLALGFVNSWVSFIIIFIIAKIGCSLGMIFYDAMLADVTTQDRMDNISSVGYAFGYIGSCIPFALSLIFVFFYEKIGISFKNSITIAFSINAIWWLAMSIPLLKSYKQKHFVKQRSKISQAFPRLCTTIKEFSKNKKVFIFFIGFFFYIDGVYTIIDMATVYGKALGLSSNSLLLALLATQLVAFPFAILFGRLSTKYDTKNLLSLCILAYFFIAIFAIFLRTQTHFYILAVLVGMFQGGIQALSRSHFGKIIPPEKSGEYFGILDICGKGASFMGTMLVSLTTQLSGELYIGISIIAPLILLGFILFRVSLKYEN